MIVPSRRASTNRPRAVGHLFTITDERADDLIYAGVTTLPGCNAVQPGPARATQATGCGAPTTTEPASKVSFLKAIDGWQAVGCAAEPSGQSLLTGGTTTDAGMTVEKCLNTCAGKGFKFAGLKNMNTCSCGSSVDTSKISSTYACNFACAGDATGK